MNVYGYTCLANTCVNQMMPKFEVDPHSQMSYTYEIMAGLRFKRHESVDTLVTCHQPIDPSMDVSDVGVVLNIHSLFTHSIN